MKNNSLTKRKIKKLELVWNIKVVFSLILIAFSWLLESVTMVSINWRCFGMTISIKIFFIFGTYQVPRFVIHFLGIGDRTGENSFGHWSNLFGCWFVSMIAGWCIILGMENPKKYLFNLPI